MTINTEWLWTPHDSHVDGHKFNKGDMSPKAYREEIAFYSQLIKKYDVHIVALSEIESELVAKDVVSSLGAMWSVHFKQGRDTATGQDVAILTKLQYKKGSTTHFGFPSGKLAQDKMAFKGKRLSKVVGVMLDGEAVDAANRAGKNRKLGVITSHFLSKRNESRKKSLNRQRQAHALVKAIDVFAAQADALVVMGDLNDVIESPTLSVLKTQGELKLVEEHCAKDPNNQLVDHILFRGLSCIRRELIDLKGFSDHDAVYAEFAYE